MDIVIVIDAYCLLIGLISVVHQPCDVQTILLYDMEETMVTVSCVLWVGPFEEYRPSGWFRVNEGSISHDFHPGLHLFGCVGAEIIRPHVGVSGLAV